MPKVRIKQAPKGTGNFITPQMMPNFMSTKSEPDTEVRKVMQPVDKEFANVEVEKDEMIMLPDTKAFPGFPSLFKAGGNRHSEGGTPLSLPNDSFIFSDTKDMKIKDNKILAEFGKIIKKKGRKSFTPAELADQYQINDYLKVLSDSSSTPIEVSTAERMIKNYNMKLGKLGLVQESMKGFPDGIPAISVPYLYNVGVDPATVLPGPQFTPQVRMHQTPMMQKGGPVKGDVIIDKDPSEDMYQFELRLQKAQQDNPGKKIYVKGPDGGYKMLQGNVVPSKGYTGNIKMGELANSYGQLTNVIETNPGLQDLMYKNYQKRIKESTRLGKSTKERLLSKPKEEVINNFLNFQQQTYGIAASGIDLKDPNETWDKGGKERNKIYQQTASQLGFDPLDEDQIAMAQGAYYGMQDAADTKEYGKLLSNFNITPVGKSDEPGTHKNISPVDSIFGNTTAGQAVLSKGTYQLLNQETDPEGEDEVIPYDTPPAQFKQSGVSSAKWWTQDMINTLSAARNYFGVKKYNPFLQTVDFQEPSPTFVSPERALAANAEQANIASNAMGAFAGPQALSSRLSNIQGTGATQAANIMAQTNNQNVGIANQFELYKNQIRNQETGFNANAIKNFYDQTVIANQQYDNAKAQGRDVMRQTYNTGLTNAQQTATLNAMYPHFQTDPFTGQVYFEHGSNRVPGNQSYTNPALESYKQAMLENPEISPNILAKFFTNGAVQDQSWGGYPDPTDMYGAGNTQYPANYYSKGGSTKKVRIKRVPKY